MKDVALDTGRYSKKELNALFKECCLTNHKNDFSHKLHYLLKGATDISGLLSGLAEIPKSIRRDVSELYVTAAHNFLTGVDGISGYYETAPEVKLQP